MAKKTAWTEASVFSPILYLSSAFALYDIFSSVLVFLWKKKYCHFTCLLSAIMIVDVSSSKLNNKLGWKWTQTARTHCPLWQKASVVKENGMNRSEQWLFFIVLWFHQMLPTKQVAAILVCICAAEKDSYFYTQCFFFLSSPIISFWHFLFLSLMNLALTLTWQIINRQSSKLSSA